MLLTTVCTVVLAVLVVTESGFAQNAKYIGVQACSQCHQEEYDNFLKFSKKAHSIDSVKRMAKDLTQDELNECYQCHSTGFGEPTGFKSFEETPHLANAGCESCHGPGSTHAETEDPDDIKGSLTIQDCETCHNAERVNSFNFKPLIYGGAH
ncbi:MAG: cytochrome c family protein [Desulfovibrio sp.]